MRPRIAAVQPAIPGQSIASDDGVCLTGPVQPAGGPVRKLRMKDHQFDRGMFWALITFQALFFHAFYVREIAWYPPQHDDQVAYLIDAYRLQEHVLAKGPRELWRALWSHGHYSTLTFPIEGALTGFLLGGTRLPQLCVLFIAFCALQVVAFTVARSVWGRRIYGYILLGLIFSQSTLWYWAGGLFDFRLDFFAYSLYGIWACVVVRSNVFLDRRWAIVAGLIGAFLVLNRFLTIIYLLGVSIGLVAVFAVVWFLQRANPELRRRMRKRLTNLGLSLGVFFIIAAPVLLINRAAIYSKYVVGQFFYEKDVRAQELGVFDLSGHLLFYPKSIVNDHLGPAFLWASAIGIAGALAAGALALSRGGRSRGLVREAPRRDETGMLEIIFLLGAIVGPLIVLTIDVSKSPVIGGIVGVPAALLVTSFIARFAAGVRASESPSGRKLFFGCSLVVFALGLLNQFSHGCRHLPEYAQRRDLRRLAELDRWFVEYASDHAWSHPAISCDVVSGWFNAGPITASGYEQSGKLIEFRQMLGVGIMGVDKPEALSLLKQSDFLILTTMQKAGVYPFYQRIAQYWDDLKAWADTNMLVVRTEPFDGFTAVIYARPGATVSGLSNGWVTSAGFSVEATHAALKKFPVFQLSGIANYSWLPKVPTVSATVDFADGVRTVPASFRRSDNGYEITVDTSSMQLPPSDPVRVHLKFDTFFVPKNLHISNDTRELVIQAPTVVELIRPP